MSGATCSGGGGSAMARSDATLVEHSAFFDQLVELVPAK